MFDAEQLRYAALAAAFLLLGRYFVLSRWYRTEQDEFWDKIDKVGVSSGVWPWARAVAASCVSLQKNAHEGYLKFCKPLDRPFALPTMLTGKAMLVLPPSQLHLLNRSDKELSGFWPLIENIQLHYFITDRDVIENVIHFEVSRKDLTKRNVERLCGPAADEIDAAYRELWGTDTEEWKTFNGWEKCGSIIARCGMRSLCGYPMSRNKELFEQMRAFADSLFATAAIISCCPPFTRSFLGRLLSIKARRHGDWCLKILIPFVKERIAIWERHTKGEIKQDELPDDFVQWLIPRCAARGPENLDPGKIAMRLLALNTMFVYGMSFVFASTVMDVYSSPNKDDFIGEMEEECRRVTSEGPNGLGEKALVDRLYRVDSAIRESMRLSDVSVVTMPRDVMGNKPFVLQNGITVPPGTRMVFNTQAMHMDPDNYDDPLTFDALRFSRPYEGQDASDGTRPLISNPTPSWIALGYGKGSCPGRWYVAQTIKQSLAYLVMHYDVELIEGEPKRKAMLNMMIPPMDQKMRVRRKAQ